VKKQDESLVWHLPLPETGAGFYFLLVEVQAGLTLIAMASALPPDQGPKIQRLLGKARRAYEIVLKFRGCAESDNPELTLELENGLEQLRSSLHRLGEIA
jgi:hypothetical protein